MGKKSKENARAVCEGLEDAEVLALSKALSDKCKAVTDARKRLKTDVYPVDMLVRITGDVEIGAGGEQAGAVEGDIRSEQTEWSRVPGAGTGELGWQDAVRSHVTSGEVARGE